jgi:hypothetical protein
MVLHGKKEHLGPRLHYSIAFGNNTFIAVGNSSTIISSSNGVDWEVVQHIWAPEELKNL